jgi:hypothetical protein
VWQVRAGIEVGVLGEDGGFGLAEPGTRIHTEFFVEDLAGSAESGQGFALPTGVIEGQGEETPGFFAKWSSRDLYFQGGDGLTRSAVGEQKRAAEFLGM